MYLYQHVLVSVPLSEVPPKHAERTLQELMRTLSVLVRNWCVPWAYSSGTDAYPERTRQELMRTLSVLVRNWCVPWAYSSGTDGYPEHMQHHLTGMRTAQHRRKNSKFKKGPFKPFWAYALGTGACTQRVRQDLTRALRRRITDTSSLNWNINESVGK